MIRLEAALVCAALALPWEGQAADLVGSPKSASEQTILDRDRQFDDGSVVELERLSKSQIDNLVSLGKVWGFLKYHHPRVVAGDKQWDYELFRVLPAVLRASSRHTAHEALTRWIDGLGPVDACSPCATLTDRDLAFGPSLSWLHDKNWLGEPLSARLISIHRSRPAATEQFYVSLIQGVRNPSFNHELPYSGVRLPDAGFQLLSVYRFWNIVEYWFPYRDVLGEDWNEVLATFIPRVALAQDAASYQRELMALIAKAHDSHANLWSSLTVRPPVGRCQIPVNLRFVQGRLVVTSYALADASPKTGLSVGDEITAIDATPVDTLVREWAPYYASSNDAGRTRDIARSITRGACGEVTVGVKKQSAAATLAMTRMPVEGMSRELTHDLPGPAFQLLSNDVAYLKLSSVKVADVPGYLEAARNTKGLVIDIRNYPSEFVVFALGSMLVDRDMPFARFTFADVSNPGAFHWSEPISLRKKEPRYGGKIVVLVDEITQSQAEYTTMAFRSAPGAKVVGSTTAGADGNVSAIPLPGGLRAMISGIGVFYPDKRPTQRVGILPDVEVWPSVEGIRAGRDEVLEAAVREIIGPTAPPFPSTRPPVKNQRAKRTPEYPSARGRESTRECRACPRTC